MQNVCLKGHDLFYRFNYNQCVGNPGLTAGSQHQASCRQQSKRDGSMGDGVEMSQHNVTHRNTWQTRDTLREEQPTEKLDWPVFCGSRKNKENAKKKKKKKKDMVRVQPLSSLYTLSRKFHALEHILQRSTEPNLHVHPGLSDDLTIFV